MNTPKVREVWTNWSGDMYIKCGPSPTWRALFLWMTDEVFWRFRLVFGDPDYADDLNRGSYWNLGWAQGWADYYSRYHPFPRKW